MNSEETNITRRVMLALGSMSSIRIFRNNSGKCWIGASKQFTKPETVNVKAGDVLVQNARFFIAGLCVGSSDLIGFKSVEITPEMIGKKIAIFTAAEIKTASGKVSTEQIAFINMVNKFGGIGFIARNEKEALDFINVK